MIYKFKIIKKFPLSPNVGTIGEFEGLTENSWDFNISMTAQDCIDYPEFFEPVVTIEDQAKEYYLSVQTTHSVYEMMVKFAKLMCDKQIKDCLKVIDGINEEHDWMYHDAIESTKNVCENE